MQIDKVFRVGFGSDRSSFSDRACDRPLMNAQSRDCAESIEAVDSVDYLRLNMLEFQRKRSCDPDMQGSAFAFGPARKA